MRTDCKRRRASKVAALILVLAEFVSCSPSKAELPLLQRDEISSVTMQTPEDFPLMATLDPSTGYKLGRRITRKDLLDSVVGYFNENRDGFYAPYFATGEGFASVVRLAFYSKDGKLRLSFDVGAKNQSVYDPLSKTTLYRDDFDHPAFVRFCRRFGINAEQYCRNSVH